MVLELKLKGFILVHKQGQRERTGNGMGILNCKAYHQQDTSSNKAIALNPSQADP